MRLDKCYYDYMIIRLTFIALLTVPCLCLSAQQLSFSILKGDKRIGVQRITQTQTGSETHYRLKGDASFWAMGKKKLSFISTCVVEDDMVKRAEVKEIVNDKIRSHTVIECDGNSATFISESDDETSQVSRSIPAITISLLMEEPVGVDEIFSERYGEFLKLESMGSGQYALHMPNGRTNIYSYNDDGCQSVAVDHWFANIEFVRN